MLKYSLDDLNAINSTEGEKCYEQKLARFKQMKASKSRETKMGLEVSKRMIHSSFINSMTGIFKKANGIGLH